MGSERRISLATIRMEVHGRELAFNVPVPQEPSRLLDLLPATGAIASQEAQANIDASRARGKDISCRAGCGACCRQLVAISAVEAQALHELVERMPEERRAVIRERFAAGIRRLEEAGLLDPREPPGRRMPVARQRATASLTLTDLGHRYFQLGIACPFLEEESCGIYEDRPAVCREYHVTSPAENCKHIYEVQVDRLEPSFHVSEILGKVARRLAGVEQNTLMLIQSLEWAEANPDALKVAFDGRQMFGVLIEELAKLASGKEATPGEKV